MPSATEMLFALGLGGDVVAVTHECDYPNDAHARPRITRSTLPQALSVAEIDAAVKQRAAAGQAIYELDAEALRALRPDLIVTQDLCQVCAISADDVRAIAQGMDSVPAVISLNPHTLGEVFGDARTIAQATDSKDAAVDLIREASDRIDRLRLAVRGAERPSVVALEWLDPPYVAGHWTPQMIDYAGGIDVLGFAGEHSVETTWDLITAAEPDLVLVMPCGFDAEIAAREAQLHRDQLARTGASRIVAVDAAAYFSRPGPRLVDGLELLAQIIHPQIVPENSEYAGRAITVKL